MNISTNNNRLIISNINDHGSNNNVKLQGINIYNGPLKKLIGFIMEKILHKFVSVDLSSITGNKDRVYINSNSFVNWYQRISSNNSSIKLINSTELVKNSHNRDQVQNIINQIYLITIKNNNIPAQLPSTKSQDTSSFSNTFVQDEIHNNNNNNNNNNNPQTQNFSPSEEMVNSNENSSALSSDITPALLPQRKKTEFDIHELSKITEVDTLRNLQHTLSVKEIPKVNIPLFENFQGTKSQINTIFSTLLSNSRGVVVGESHAHLSPKKVLVEQMAHLAKNEGVKTLFLEFCCYDTIQAELDEYFKTKKPSDSLKNFLEKGYGGFITYFNQPVNYFPLIKAAVEAGIKPVGLEFSNTIHFGYDDEQGSKGADRILGLIVVGTKIIENELSKDDGKYIVFVGSTHISYCCNVAGFSELCGVPSVVIVDREKASLAKDIQNLDLQNSNYLDNSEGKIHHTDILLRIAV